MPDVRKLFIAKLNTFVLNPACCIVRVRSLHPIYSLSTNMSTGQQATVTPFRPLPVFKIEIEIFVKVKRKVVPGPLNRMRTGGGLHAGWAGWDFDLSDRSTDADRLNKQRSRVAAVIKGLINESQNHNSGWESWDVTTDVALRESKLTVPPDRTSWC
jgi:hypothetical protein